MKYIIFGAGLYGKNALKEYGTENVLCFVDNDRTKQGSFIEGKEILSLEQVLKIHYEAKIVVASQYISSMERQLKQYGITSYEIYKGRMRRLFETDELVFNPYLHNPQIQTEQELNSSNKLKYSRKGVYDECERLAVDKKIFNHIEIETINRCNGSCDFCPVNQKLDPRERKLMSEKLFYKIVEQLETMQYSGRFATFSNNEPLLDDRIVELNEYARKHLPLAKMHIYTNGTLLTMQKFLRLIEILDELIIDNYSENLKLIKPCSEIVKYAEKHPEINKKVTIVLRNPHEILTSRGGDAPNRYVLSDYGDDRCVLPFKQMIIRPDGKVSLCCNDPLGKYTMGDANKDSLLDIWFGREFEAARDALYRGRKHWGNCRQCDTFIIG